MELTVQNTSVSPDGKALAVLGDSSDCLIADSQSGKVNTQDVYNLFADSELHVTVCSPSRCCLLTVVCDIGQEIATLRGHLDYSFSSAWHPDGRVLATGNQDRTCRLWDVRNTSQSLAVLQGRIGSIRGLEFSPDGRFLAAAEPADFVHVCDVSAGYARAQEIGIFGEIAGVSFSPDDGAQALFVGVADRTYGGLLEFRRRRTHGYYLDCYL